MQVSNTLSVSDLKTVSTQSVPPIDRSPVPTSVKSSTNVSFAALEPDIVTFSNPVPTSESSDLIPQVNQSGNTPDISSDTNQITADQENVGDERGLEPRSDEENSDAVSVRLVPGGDEEERTEQREVEREDASRNENERQSPQQQELIEELVARDAEVKSHERAHQAVGGQYAGSISYTYQTGPDGKRYAIGGEVPIDVAPISGDPQATIDKMRTVRAAALAPSEPSAQDRTVASTAQRLLIEAQIELAEQKRVEREASQERASSNQDQTNRAIRLYEGFIGLGVNEADPKDLIDELV